VDEKESHVVSGDRGRQSNYVQGTAKGTQTIFLEGLRNRLTKSEVSIVTIRSGFVDIHMTPHIKKTAFFADSEGGRGKDLPKNERSKRPQDVL